MQRALRLKCAASWASRSDMGELPRGAMTGVDELSDGN